MKSSRVFFVVAIVGLAFTNARATDLSQIERTIDKEPAYRNKAPTYSLLVFGPSAKLRMWLVLDGTDLYVDKNCDGSLDALDERFQNDGEGFTEFEINDEVTGDIYQINSVSVIRVKKDKEDILLLSTTVTIKGKFRQYSGGISTARIDEASVSHFNGPLTLDINRDRDGKPTDKLVIGGDAANLNVMIGTFDRKNGCWVVVENRDQNNGEDFSIKLNPIVEMEFASAEGGVPIKIRNPLAERC